MRTTFFFGAGCSYGTLKLHKGSYPPIARCFGSELANRLEGDCEAEYPRLAQVAKHQGKGLKDMGLEDLWTSIDYHAKFEAAFRTEWEPRGKVVTELKSALLLLYGSRCDEAAEKLTLGSSTGRFSFRDKDDYTLSKIVRDIKPGDTLISFNYDTLVERVCMKRNDLNVRHSAASADDIVRFSKPHGSVSWNIFNLTGDIIDGPPLLKSLDKDQVKNEVVNPLVLGAVPIKSELIREVQEFYHARRVYDVVLHQWRAVADAVRDADRVVILGYSFPQQDTYGSFFYREAMLERRAGAALRVDYYEKCEQKQQIESSIRLALPGELRVHYKGEVTPAPVF